MRFVMPTWLANKAEKTLCCTRTHTYTHIRLYPVSINLKQTIGDM